MGSIRRSGDPVKLYNELEKKPRWTLKKVIITLAVVFVAICITVLLIAPLYPTPEPTKVSFTAWNEDRPLEDEPYVFPEVEEAYVPEAWTGPFVGIYRGSFYGKAYLGMSATTVRERCGSPDGINRTVGSWGIHEQWVYGQTIHWRVYLYFQNGYLTSWQE